MSLWVFGGIPQALGLDSLDARVTSDNREYTFVLDRPDITVEHYNDMASLVRICGPTLSIKEGYIR